MIRSSRLTGALIDGRLFDQSIVGVFPKDDTWVYYLLGFFNSSVCTELINAINPSTNNSANYIKKIPFVTPREDVRLKVDALVKKIVATLKSGKSDISAHEKELDEIFANLYLEGVGADNKGLETVKNRTEQLNLFGNSNSALIMRF